MVMGQPERCQHALHLINELIQTAQVSQAHNFLFFRGESPSN